MAEEEVTERTFLSQLRDTMQGLSKGRRTGIIGVGIVSLIAFGYIMIQGAVGSGFVPVARGMNAEDESAAVAALEAKKIPYKLDHGGTIKVPEDKIHEARLELAVSTGGGKLTGFEIFDAAELGRSSFNEKVNYNRALAGELSRTIRTVRPVESARVHLVIPPRSLFSKHETKPSASVVVKLKPGMELSKRQVQAIRHLVAGAVERLQPNQVAVVDQAGTMLARADDEGGFSADVVFEQQSDYERGLERRIISLLEPTVGNGKVRVKVTAQLDFSRTSETQEKYDADSQVIRSEREKREKSSKNIQPAQGAPGTASNLPTRVTPRAAHAGSPSQSERTDHLKNYEIDKIVKRTETPHPRVAKLSVSVVIDERADAADGTKQPWTDEQKESFETIVTSAVGADANRGDVVKVTVMPFQPPIAVGDGADGTNQTPQSEWVKLGIIGGAFLIALVIVLLMWRRHRRQQMLREAAEVDHLALDSAPVNMDQMRVQREISELRAKAVEQGQADVLLTASVIRNWLAEGSGVGA